MSDYKPYICMQTNSMCYKQTTKMKPVGILWHSTGANNPNLKRYVQPTDKSANYAKDIKKLGVNTNGNDWNHIQVKSGVNAWVGKFADGSIGTVQTMPWDYRPWGCGTGSKGSCNNGWIQFEICEDALSDKAYAKAVYDEAVKLTAYLCEKYKLDPNGTVTVSGVKIPVITCHNDANKLGFGTAHADINHWFPKLLGKSMSDVRKDVAALMKKAAAPTTSSKSDKKTTTSSTPAASKFKEYKAKVNVAALNVRAGAGTSYKVNTVIKKGEVYTIVEEKNGWGKLKSGAGWIMLKYIVKI